MPCIRTTSLEAAWGRTSWCALLAPRAVFPRGDIRDSQQQDPRPPFLLPQAWEANMVNWKLAPKLTLFFTHPAEAPHKSELGQVNGNGLAMPPDPTVLPNSKTLILLELPRKKSFKKCKGKLIDLFDVVLIGN